MIMIKASIIKYRPTGDPWVSVNPTGTGFDKIQKPITIWVFNGFRNFHGSRSATAKPSGFVPIAIPKCLMYIYFV